MKHFCAKCGKPTIYALALPKFCSQCGSEFSLVTKQKDKSPHDHAIEKNKEKSTPNTPSFAPVTKAEPKLHPNPARASLKYKLVHDDYQEHDDEPLDTEDEEAGQESYDTSLFARIKPKFKLQATRNTSESFESIVTQSYASNYKPIDASSIHNDFPNMPQRSADSILEEFKREAGSSRQQD
jgi:predicted  nucleic acid-binding Zn-ribbon protein